jgi:OPT family oligopeptide transporter
MTPEQIVERDREWLKTHYRGDTDPQLTVRSIVLGMLLGVIMSFSNLYVGLKIGWGLGVAITSSILAFAIMAGLRRLFPRWITTDFSILENNTMASCASAAGYMSSAGLVSAIPALDMMLRDNAASGHPDPSMQSLALGNVVLMLWITAISFLGVVMAVPLKRQLINIEQLKFPSAVAAAETLKSMYSKGTEAITKAKALGYTALAGAVIKFVAEAKQGDASRISGTGLGARISRTLNGALSWKRWGAPEILTPSVLLKGYPLASYSIGLAPSSLMIAAGAIIGLKIGASLFLGALINFGVLLPWLVDHGVFERVVRGAPNFSRAAIEARHHVPITNPTALSAFMRGKWSVWPGTALMVTSGLLSFAFRWRLVMRTFAGTGDKIRKLFSKGNNEATTANDALADPLAHIEIPSSWFATGFVLAGTATVVLQIVLFGIRWWIAILAVFLTFVLSMVAARATGETDINPVGAMGKITQLMFGGLAPTRPAVNLMTANVTAGASSHSADLLTDVKTGYLLGANPRKQFIAQLFGVVAGGVACVPVYRMIARPEALGTRIPAPAAMTWRSVAELLTHGFGALPMYATYAMIAGGIAGVIISCLEEFVPKYKKYYPSATGLGIAFVVDFKDSFAMFLGAVIAWQIARRRPEWEERYTVAVSSGFIAGESLLGVLLAALAALDITAA